ncbi:MAG: ferrochelatase, partial [Xenococcaceae cyanobacterium]
IVMMPIGFATENHETLLDVHHIIHHLEHRSKGVQFVQMPCVNDRPEFLAMAALWANSQIEALLSETAVKVNESPVSTHHHHHHHHH